jgi:hypothetical protein
VRKRSLRGSKRIRDLPCSRMAEGQASPYLLDGTPIGGRLPRKNPKERRTVMELHHPLPPSPGWERRNDRVPLEESDPKFPRLRTEEQRRRKPGKHPIFRETFFGRKTKGKDVTHPYRKRPTTIFGWRSIANERSRQIGPARTSSLGRMVRYPSDRFRVPLEP